MEKGKLPVAKKIRYKTADEIPPFDFVVRELDTCSIVDRIRGGLPFGEFSALRQMLDLTEDRLGELVGIPKATLHRRKKSGQLERTESDRLVRYAKLFQKAVEALGGEQEARNWLNTPAMAFHGETPLDYSDTEVGAREVEALLGRIEEGVFS